MPALTLSYDHFDPDQEPLREALTSTGNGYFCTRGCAEWEDCDGVHYPGTYANGLFNRETSIFDGRPVLNEDLVNLPNWLVLKLRCDGERAVKLENVTLLDYHHELDVDAAVLTRDMRFRDEGGRVTRLRSRRFVSMADVHQAGVEWTLTAENWSGRLELVTGLDGRMTNRMVARYRQLEGRHLNPVSPRTFGPEIIALKARTRQSTLFIGEAARTRVFLAEETEPLAVPRQLYQMEDYIQQILTVDIRQDVPVRVEKMVAFYTSRDAAINEPLGNAGKSAGRLPDFATALQRHRAAWADLWQMSDIELPAEPEAQRLLRLHIAHVLQVCSPNTARYDAGVPARGLNGEAYRGHVFWDELYIYPFLNFRFPDITRNLIKYRYRRLGEARAMAREAGLRGAMFPWQSGSDGSEETQVVHLNPLSGRWDPDLSRLQRHVNAAIFANVWRYYEVTGDLEFLIDHGAELMLEIARFWASMAHYNPDRGRYEIHGVMGPDEFHERYPDSEQGGLRNNAYTNVMVAWICGLVPRVLDLLPPRHRAALCSRLQITEEEQRLWQDMSRKMFVPFKDGMIDQFEGYLDLKELDWDRYRATYGNIQRMDRILRAEGDDPNRYQVTKQADTVLLNFLFDDDELRELFARLGYDYPPGMAHAVIDYYDRRTSHGSTLSLVTHAGVLAELDPETSWRRYLVALHSDVDDIQGGTTREGIHLGVMSGTLDVLQRRYLGCRVKDGVLWFSPRMLDRLDGLVLHLQFHGTTMRVNVAGRELILHNQAESTSAPIMIGVGEDMRRLYPGERLTFPLATPTAVMAGNRRER